MIFLLLELFICIPFAIGRPTSFECRTHSKAIMVSDQAASRVQYGAASELAADLAHPWPEVEHNGRKLRVVTYCYSNKEVRDWLDDYVKAAITRWKEKLSSPPFKGTTNLAWQELHDGNLDPCKRQPRFCFGPTKEWDRENVPGDTLWVNIDHDQGAGGKSTVGYLPPNHENEVAYQHMKLGSEVTVEAIVHEVSTRETFDRGTANN